MELQHGAYYWDKISHVDLIFEDESDGYYWFYCTDEYRHIAYYEFELENVWRYW